MTINKQRLNFWEELSLEEMSKKQWEMLCDGCGLCCLHKFEDEYTSKIFFTDVVCQYIEEETCKCKHYESRNEYVPDCLNIKPDWGAKFNWLPSSCAYRLLYEKKSLHDWHPLVSGQRDSVHMAGISVRGRAFSDADISDEDIFSHIIEWVES